LVLYRALATVGGLTLVSRILGFVRDILIAAVLGAGAVADAFFVAFRFPNMFRRLFAEGAFDSAFVPLFAKRLHGDGEVAARSFAEQALALLTAALVVFTILAEIFMPWLMYLLAPGFAADPDKFDLAVLLTRIALPYLLFMSLVALYTGMLNAHGRFAAAALVPSLLNVVLILVLLGIILSGNVGLDQAGVALALGIAAGGILQIAAVMGAAWRAGIRLAPRMPKLSPEMRRLLALLAPGIVAGGVAQLNIVVSTVIASLQDRAVSWIYYAERIYQLPFGMVGVAIGIVLLPTLVRALRASDREAAIASENRSLELALLLSLPAALALFLASDPIIRVLFERGAFTAVDTRATSQILSAFALGVPAFVMAKVFQPGFFAREDTRTPMLFAVASVLVNVACSLLLFIVMGAVGIALAASIAGWTNLVLLVREQKRRGLFEIDALFRRRFPAILGATAIMGLAVWALLVWLGPYFSPANGIIIQFAALSALVGGGLLVYGAGAQLLGAVDLRALPKLFTRA
jgi:putative peptidoglycan lipid II flippase